MATITMQRTYYDSLLAAAEGDERIDVPELKRIIDADNGIVRYFLFIRWQELGGRQPTRIEIGDGVNWPPHLEFKLTQEKPISREDVDIVLQTQATNPVDPMVTRDPEGVVGWTLLPDYDFTLNAS